MTRGTGNLDALLQAALVLKTPAERAAYLDHACPDAELRGKVKALLARYEHPDPLCVGDASRAHAARGGGSTGYGLYLGRTLDEKYLLERMLGQGGMGSVYLATHMGTGRYVAVKLMAPPLMRNPEFVERFKREARAAGRLRHPNIVDVTDFGVATVDGERVAYLVMEYLDGCTLGEVLAEQGRLPLHWVVDILEQVCSAVREAHERGIIHRDLKPANIWLEPNTLGGYRVKVLDFGIAKLADVADTETATRPLSTEGQPDGSHPPEASATLTLVPGGVGPTATGALEPSSGIRSQDAQTKVTVETSHAETLTRVGAILGTPSYMSPEQCRGENLDARSDVYSLGVVAYQMISGSAPFTGELAAVLRAQQEIRPTPLHEYEHKLPRPVSRVIMSALEKSPADRPQTALAFGRALKANAEGLGALYRRAFALYSEYFPEVIKISLVAHVPMTVVTLMMIGLRVADPWLGRVGLTVLGLLLGLLKIAVTFGTGSAISGLIAVIVTQLSVTPLKPVTLRAAFVALRQCWGPFLRTGSRATLRILLGLVLFVVPGFMLMTRYALWAPVVLFEGKEGKAALERASSLAARSWSTTLGAVIFQVLVPILVQSVIGRLLGLEPGGRGGVGRNVVSELITLTSIVVLPLVSIVLALVYLKLRRLAGEEMPRVPGPVSGAR